MFDFDFDLKFDLNFDNEDEKTYLKKQKIAEIVSKQIKNIKEIGKPKKGEQFRIVTHKSLNAFGIMQYILEEDNIEEMYMSVFDIRKDIVDILVEQINQGKIKKATVLVSDFFKSQDRNWVLTLNAFKKQCKNINFSVFNVHTKIICMKVKDNYYVVEGSGNLKVNAKVEQYLFENNKEMFDFHKEWIKELTALNYIDKDSMKGASTVEWGTLKNESKGNSQKSLKNKIKNKKEKQESFKEQEE